MATLKEQINAYQVQPFEVKYKVEDIIRTAEGLETKDGKYKTLTDSKGFSYWSGDKCYCNIAYGYFFLHSRSTMLQEAVTNLNQTLSDTYEFNPDEFQRKLKIK